MQLPARLAACQPRGGLANASLRRSRVPVRPCISRSRLKNKAFPRFSICLWRRVWAVQGQAKDVLERQRSDKATLGFGFTLGAPTEPMEAAMSGTPPRWRARSRSGPGAEGWSIIDTVRWYPRFLTSRSLRRATGGRNPRRRQT